ncbi:uncharacterized protein SAPINGB_P005235 [Magnusiomyces paraingens]|uniref:Protein RER1 n=1 Tax=Magnusiomyces paraingens TaxID=2606893 RepID=A0A5E8C678_9ASCO|nr:uncharacterized protein SAPINGB_P005235 [Saprochaete ingens]VVT56726.1 unnamed protein product [Saprochaete ingens]
MDDFVDSVPPKLRKYLQLYQSYLDRSVPHVGVRWSIFGGLLVVFLLRIVIAQGWYIVCYALGIYLLNLFLLFLQPKFDPSLEQEERREETQAAESLEEGSEAGPSTSGADFDGIPTEEAGNYDRDHDDDRANEFRPFIRRLPEFKFWYNGVRATVAALVCSFFDFFDIPVFWPILLMYFIVLFVLTMRRQLQHMLKYRYLPFDLGKTKYNK